MNNRIQKVASKKY